MMTENYLKQIHRRQTAEAVTLERIRQVRPIAQAILLEGLDVQADWQYKIPCEPLGLPEQQLEHLNQWSESCLLVGIALGLLLRPRRLNGPGVCDEPGGAPRHETVARTGDR